MPAPFFFVFKKFPTTSEVFVIYKIVKNELYCPLHFFNLPSVYFFALSIKWLLKSTYCLLHSFAFSKLIFPLNYFPFKNSLSLKWAKYCAVSWLKDNTSVLVHWFFFFSCLKSQYYNLMLWCSNHQHSCLLIWVRFQLKSSVFLLKSCWKEHS